MGRMIDKLKFTRHEGSKNEHDLALYALSTCAFCRRAIEYLKQHDVSFRYIYLDQINPMVKRTVKSELKGQFDSIPVFPVLVIDDRQAISGFTEERWNRALGL